MDRAALIVRLRAAGCVWAEDEADLLLTAAADAPGLEALTRRREAGEPLEQVLGRIEFCGVTVHLAPGVFVPRRRSAVLVAAAVARSRERPLVLDLCAGSGALGAAFAAAVPGTELHVAELDPLALECARRTVPAGTALYRGDLFDPLPPALRGRVDVLLANAPYVPTAEVPRLPPEAREHEPLVALDGGADGLDVHRRILPGAADWLAPGGFVAVELARSQVDTAQALMRSAGLAPELVTDEDAGATVLIGVRET